MAEVAHCTYVPILTHSSTPTGRSFRRKRRRRKLTYDRATSTQPSVSTFPVGLNSAAGCGGSSCSQSANVQTLPASAFKSNIQEYRAPLQNQTQGSREKEGGVSAHQKKIGTLLRITSIRKFAGASNPLDTATAGSNYIYIYYIYLFCTYSKCTNWVVSSAWYASCPAVGSGNFARA